MPPPDRVFLPPAASGHRGILGPFMDRHGLGHASRSPAPTASALRHADLAGLSPEDVRLLMAQEGDPYLVGLEDEPVSTESPASQAHLDDLYAHLGVAEEPWERAFWREAEQQRRNERSWGGSGIGHPVDVGPANQALTDVTLTIGGEPRSTAPPPIPPRRPALPSVPDPGYFGQPRPPDRVHAILSRPPVPVGLTARDLDVVTRTALGEARGEPKSIRDDAMAAVVETIRNRYLRGERQYGFLPEEIALKHRGSTYQYLANDPHWPSDNYYGVTSMLPGDQLYDRAYRIARDVFTHARPDIANGATHFVGQKFNPKTGRPYSTPKVLGDVEYVGRIGEHALYRARD